jgi:hypothetical protein
MTIIKRIDPWRTVYKCWYSKDVYRDAAHCWRGLGFRYLSALLFVLWLLASIHVHILVHEFAIEYLKPLVAQIPRIEIKDGIATVDRPDRIFQINDPRNGRKLIGFDLTDTPERIPVNVEGIFFEKRRVLFHLKGNEQIYDFEKQKDQTWEWDYHPKILDAIAFWSGPIVLAVFWISSLILCALQALLFGFTGKLIAILAKRRLTYPQLVRVSVVAMTPALIIDTCQKLFCVGLPAWDLVSVLIGLAYLIYGVKVNSVSFEWSLSQAVTPLDSEKNLQA